MKHYPTLALITLALSNLSLQATLVLLRGVFKAFAPGGSYGWLEPELSASFTTVSFGVALLMLTYSRLPVPGKQLICSMWIAASAALADFDIARSNAHLLWLALIPVTGVWIAHALLIFARWHFGTVIDLPGATPAKRQSLFSLETVLSWLPIGVVLVAGYLLLLMMRGPWPYTEFDGIVGQVLNATFRGLTALPFLLPLLARRHVWFWCGFSATAVFVCILVLAASQSRPMPAAANTIEWMILARSLLSFLPLVSSAVLLRVIGFRWTETEPWPAPVRMAPEPTPNPFA